MNRGWLACMAIAASVAITEGARAEEPIAPSSVTVSAQPIFGADASVGTGWFEVAVHVDNGGSAPVKGTLELSATIGYGVSEQHATERAPFNVAAGRSATILIPAHGSVYFMPQLTLTATTDAGVKLATSSVSVTAGVAPLLVDFSQPSRLGVAMRSWPITTATWNPGTGASSSLSVGAPQLDHTTGDPILPDRATAYAPVTLVIARSSTLAAMGELERDALEGWVLSGGTIAIVVSRPEDLRAPLVETLAGGEPHATAFAPRLLELPASPRSTAAPEIGGTIAPPSIGDPSLEPGQRVEPPRIGPLPDVRLKLQGWTGAQLRESDFGASTTHGLGEVHLLAFDPTRVPDVEDTWVHARVAQMIGRAWDRHASIALPLGAPDHFQGMDELRRALDPNESFRLGLGLSAALLVLYAIVAGPLTFARAAKKSAPLLPLKWAPVWSAIAFSAIVVVGFAGRGWKGRARHVALIEAASGSPRGSERLFRGFFTSDSGSLHVTGRGRAASMSVAPTEGYEVSPSVLRIDRDGATLGEIEALPWQTVVVREDTLADLGGGVSIAPASDGSLDVVNHTGRTLRDVLVHAPGAGIVFTPSILDGASFRSSSGTPCGGSVGSATMARPAGAMTVHTFNATDLRYALPGADGERLVEEWVPIESAATEVVDWWPDGAPVVIGVIDAPRSSSNDSGISLESERTLLRVVGSGGSS